MCKYNFEHCQAIKEAGVLKFDKIETKNYFSKKLSTCNGFFLFETVLAIADPVVVRFKKNVIYNNFSKVNLISLLILKLLMHYAFFYRFVI